MDWPHDARRCLYTDRLRGHEFRFRDSQRSCRPVLREGPCHSPLSPGHQLDERKGGGGGRAGKCVTYLPSHNMFAPLRLGITRIGSSGLESRVLTHLQCLAWRRVRGDSEAPAVTCSEWVPTGLDQGHTLPAKRGPSQFGSV